MINEQNIFSYEFDPAYSKPGAYFSMEFAIDQALKIYSGGLGFLAGSHLRSAYELKQNLVGIGILWKYGYYDQVRDVNARMKPTYVEKSYSFLEDTGIVFTINVHNSPVHVKAWLLRPETFGSAPLFLLSTDLPENDDMSRSISNRLYDSNEATRIAQSILLGTGGAILLEQLGRNTEVYHMNEGHSLSLNFHLYSKLKNLEEVKKRVVFTTHTPEAAGNESHSYSILQDMSFFCGLQNHEVHSLLGLDGDHLNYTLAALKFARKANAVSELHGVVSRDMWKSNPGICEITSITNSQNKTYWKDAILESALASGDDNLLVSRKKEMKKDLFKVVADQTGKLFDENVLTMVWARRFAGYKRADMIMNDWSRFLALIRHATTPVQLIWAGKPYPEDYGAIDLFNSIIDRVKPFANCAVLTGYELGLSALLKKGSDVWLNTPRLYREASGTSGMTAAINGSINLSIPDGWIPEFAKDMENSFIVQPADDHLSVEEKDHIESKRLLEKIENDVLPMYYSQPERWIQILKNSSYDVSRGFESGRMAAQYYEIMYNG